MVTNGLVGGMPFRASARSEWNASIPESSIIARMPLTHGALLGVPSSIGPSTGERSAAASQATGSLGAPEKRMDPGADDRDRRVTLLQLGSVEPGQPAVDHLEMPALVHRQGVARDEPCQDVQVTTRMRHPYRVGDVALLLQATLAARIVDPAAAPGSRTSSSSRR